MTSKYRRIVAASGAVALLVAAMGAAQARPDTRAMSCSQAQSLVKRNDAIVLTTGRHTYDRFVTGQRYCTYNEAARLTYVQTRDAAQCPVGYTCKQYIEDDLFH